MYGLPSIPFPPVTPFAEVKSEFPLIYIGSWDVSPFLLRDAVPVEDEEDAEVAVRDKDTKTINITIAIPAKPIIFHVFILLILLPILHHNIE